MTLICTRIMSVVLLSSIPFQGVAKEFIFAAIEGLPEQYVGGLVLTEVYQRLGNRINVEFLPAKRAEKKAATGLSDGEVMRVFEYGALNTALVRIPTAYYNVSITAFVHEDGGVQLDQIDDLQQYSLVKIRGIKNTDTLTKGMPNVSEQSDTRRLLDLVARGYADIALTNRVNGLLTLKSIGVENVVPYPLVLKNVLVYHYLHKRHQNFADQIDSQLREMKKTGELETLVKQAEIEVIQTYSQQAF